MRKKILFICSLVILVFVSNTVTAQCHGGSNSGGNHSSHNSSNKEFQGHKSGMQVLNIHGKCDMCKTRIEQAALSVKGVKAATWDKETKQLHFYFKAGGKLEDVYLAIAKVGHDSKEFKVVNTIYDRLPECCKYR